MTRRGHVAERQCIVSGNVLPQPDLMRFVVGPDSTVVPDVKGSLPGRGLWVTASRTAVEAACSKKAFARAARQKVIIPDGLADLIDHQLADRCLGLLGLARKAGELVTGFEKVKDLLRRRAAVLITARDAAQDGRRKLERLAGDIPIVSLFTVEQMSLALGRENVVHAALRDGGLARRFMVETGRLDRFRQDPVVDESFDA